MNFFAPSNYLDLRRINLEEYKIGKLSAELLELGRNLLARATKGLIGEVDHDLPENLTNIER